jgi:hypothetical protein
VYRYDCLATLQIGYSTQVLHLQKRCAALDRATEILVDGLPSVVVPGTITEPPRGDRAFERDEVDEAVVVLVPRVQSHLSVHNGELRLARGKE